MSITTRDSGALSAQRATPGTGLAQHLWRWLRQRRQTAVLRLVEPRLCEDAGLPRGAAMAPLVVPRLRVMGAA